MAEPPEAPGAEAAASERDVLLATKRHVPGPRPGLVPRPRLTERLDAELGQGLVLVCAPAGYGKTVLLANWAQCAQFPVAWLSLDAGDNDPARFWRHAVAALDRVRPGVAGRVGPLLGPPAPPSFEPLVTALINELLKRAIAPCLLVGGTADTLWDGTIARSVTSRVVEIEGADHGMFVPGDLAASAAVLGQVMTAVEQFLDDVVWR